MCQRPLCDACTNAAVAGEFDDDFVASWKGSYLDLYLKKLHVEVWDWFFPRANQFVAAADINLVAIARGDITRELNVEGLVKDEGKGRHVVKCVSRACSPPRTQH